MRERQNAKSLGAVHTHTHTHTHTNPYSMEKFGHSKMLCQQSRFVGQSGERELCLGKTERVFRAQKLEKTGKRFNIKSRLFRNDTSILGNSRAFCITKMYPKISAKNK